MSATSKPPQAAESAMAQDKNPFTDYLGMRVVRREDGTLEVELDVEDKHLNSNGTVHGGVICSLMDVSISRVLKVGRATGIGHSTVSMSVTFLQQAGRGVLRAKGRVLRSGRTLAAGTTEVYDERDRLIATATATYFVASRPSIGPAAPETGEGENASSAGA